MIRRLFLAVALATSGCILSFTSRGIELDRRPDPAALELPPAEP
jgi:hypothetical protein